MTVTPKKLAANRANAKKSTGPRTAAGKEKCSKNPVTHGIFCNDIVLPGEDAAIFESFPARGAVEALPAGHHRADDRRSHRDRAVEAAATELGRSDGAYGAHHGRLEELREELNEERLAEVDPDEPDKRELSNQIDEQMIDAEERNPDLIQGIAMSVIKDDGMLERLSRYEQRLELAIHRNLRQLDKLRKQTQSEKPDGGARRWRDVRSCPVMSTKPRES